MRVFEPMKDDHPSVGKTCWICQRKICVGQRTYLKAFLRRENKRSVEAKLCHATCALRGKEFTGFGIIDRIKDGDASPYPVITTDNHQYKLSELNLD